MTIHSTGATAIWHEKRHLRVVVLNETAFEKKRCLQRWRAIQNMRFVGMQGVLFDARTVDFGERLALQDVIQNRGGTERYAILLRSSWEVWRTNVWIRWSKPLAQIRVFQTESSAKKWLMRAA